MYTVSSNHMSTRLQDTADHRRWVADRRNEAIARQAAEVQADIARVQALYDAPVAKPVAPAPAPTFTEATEYTVTRLPGGASKARRGRQPKDTSAEAELKRARRRQRRAERKARQAANQG